MGGKNGDAAAVDAGPRSVGELVIGPPGEELPSLLRLNPFDSPILGEDSFGLPDATAVEPPGLRSDEEGLL